MSLLSSFRAPFERHRAQYEWAHATGMVLDDVLHVSRIPYLAPVIVRALREQRTCAEEDASDAFEAVETDAYAVRNAIRDGVLVVPLQALLAEIQEWMEIQGY